MIMASWILRLHIINNKNRSEYIAIGAFCMIVPAILVSMFFGLGPPPETLVLVDRLEKHTSINYKLHYNYFYFFY